MWFKFNRNAYPIYDTIKDDTCAKCGAKTIFTGNRLKEGTRYVTYDDDTDMLWVICTNCGARYMRRPLDTPLYV